MACSLVLLTQHHNQRYDVIGMDCSRQLRPVGKAYLKPLCVLIASELGAYILLLTFPISPSSTPDVAMVSDEPGVEGGIRKHEIRSYDLVSQCTHMLSLPILIPNQSFCSHSPSHGVDSSPNFYHRRCSAHIHLQASPWTVQGD